MSLLIQNYITKRLLRNIGLIYVSFIAFVFIAETLKLIKFIPASALQISDIIIFGGLLTPDALFYASSIILPIAISSSYSNMIANNEIVAMRSIGLSNWNIFKSSIYITITSGIILLIIGFEVIPRANQKFRKFIKQSTDSYVLSILKADEVINFQNLSIYYESLEGDNMLNFVVMRKSKDENNSNEYYSIYSKIAYIEEKFDEESELVLRDAEIIKLSYKNSKFISESKTATELRVKMSTLLQKNETISNRHEIKDTPFAKLIKLDNPAKYQHINKIFSIAYYTIFANLATILSLSCIKSNRGKNIKYKVAGFTGTGILTIAPHILKNSLASKISLHTIIILYAIPVVIIYGIWIYLKKHD